MFNVPRGCVYDFLSVYEKTRAPRKDAVFTISLPTINCDLPRRLKFFDKAIFKFHTVRGVRVYRFSRHFLYLALRIFSCTYNLLPLRFTRVHYNFKGSDSPFLKFVFK